MRGVVQLAVVVAIFGCDRERRPSSSRSSDAAVRDATVGDAQAGDGGSLDAELGDAASNDASTSNWAMGGGQIAADGTISGIVTSRVRIWEAESTAILFDGPIDANARVQGWDPIAPGVAIVLAEISTGTWYVTMAQVSADGSIGGFSASRAIVFDSDAELVADGAVGLTVPGWSASAPSPISVLASESEGTDPSASWWVAIWATVDQSGAVTGV